ncbi:MAG TPA: response regulator transcription factor [Mycobacteriales bacterium]|nr:response regulator transcription factor [Mycobacteriales bacterium]
MSRILVVDDDDALLQTLRLNLRARQYEVTTAETGAEALRLAEQRPPDLAIVDLGLPDMDGLQVIQELRRRSALPILVLSARGEQSDKVAALDAGSDDHVTKPFGMAELLARVRAGLRRSAPTTDAVTVTTDAFTLDLSARTADGTSGPVHLTPTEWHLLEELVRQPGRLVPQLELLQAVWGDAYGNESRHYLRVFMAQLRRKLEPDPSAPRHLITVPGTGYRFDP